MRFLMLWIFLKIKLHFEMLFLNQEQTFFVEPDYDISNREKAEAVLKEIGTHSYFYVDKKYWNEKTLAEQNVLKNYLENLSLEFDQTIYPKLRETFGEEWSPGIDNDSKITIFLVQMSNDTGGAFRLEDECPRTISKCQTSNEREMVYLNAAFMDDQRIKSFLAHEFQHMITWHHKMKLKGIDDDIWLNEGRSEYVSTAIGYDDNYPNSNLKARVDNFLKDQTDSLVEWKNEIIDYSSVNLFSQYLADRFGKAIFKSMIGNDKAGIESVNSALVDLNRPNIDFRDVFTDWTVANYLNDKTLSAGNRNIEKSRKRSKSSTKSSLFVFTKSLEVLI